MKRKEILSVAFIIVFMLILAVIAVATMPLWLTMAIIRPSIVTPLKEHLTHQAMKRAVRSMVKL